MEIKFNAVKEQRKKLVVAIGGLTGWEEVYKGAPSFSFEVGAYTVDRCGTLIYDERVSLKEVRNLLIGLSEQGFVFDGDVDEIAPIKAIEDVPVSDANVLDEAAPEHTSASVSLDRLVIEVPLEGFTRTALGNLDKLVSGKATLIMKAIGWNPSGDIDVLPVERTESTIRFPWFPVSASSDEIDAYTRFVCALCDMAKNQKRVTMKESSEIDSEKFAMRCFLLRLGFIGNEYKVARKILLSKLSGNGSFKSGGHKRTGTQNNGISIDNGEENLNNITVSEVISDGETIQ